MNVLVCCEHSGVVRDAFAAYGHNAMSCDLLPTMRKGNHYQGDARDVLDWGWDLMIAHPPCQYLSYAGIRHWNQPGRAEKREAAMAFFLELVNAPIPKIAIENPRGYPYKAFRSPDQEIHPWMFGEPQMKRTALWLKGLPKLLWYPVDSLWATACEKPAPIQVDSAKSHRPGKARYFVDITRDPLARSRTFESIARAMASQWGG